MENWIYNGIEITDKAQLPEGVIGFIYKITGKTSGKYYIGKKSIHSVRKKPLTKKELATLEDKRSSKKKTVVKESDWKTYMGSEEDLKKDIKSLGEDYFYREILHFCCNKTALTYQEVRYQILFGVLESDNCYNRNILGKFYKK